MFGAKKEAIDGGKLDLGLLSTVTTDVLNWAPQLEKLKKMNKEQLIEFMRKKGDERKDEEFNQVSFAIDADPLQTQFVTADTQLVVGFVEELENRIKDKEVRLEEVGAPSPMVLGTNLTQLEQKKESYDKQIAAMEHGNSEAKARIGRKNEARSKINNDLRSLRSEVKKIQNEISKKLVKSVYAHLEKKQTGPVVRVLEALVGCLRNRDSADEVDVELYLRKQEQLIHKMNNVDAGAIDKHVHDKHFDTVKDVTRHFTDADDDEFKVCSEYVPFLAWTTRFLILVGHAREERLLDKTIISLQETIKTNSQEINHLQTILDNFKKDNISQYLKDDIASDRARLERFKATQDKSVHECQK